MASQGTMALASSDSGNQVADEHAFRKGDIVLF